MTDRIVMKCTACGFGKCLYGDDKTKCAMPKMEVTDTADTPPRKREPKFVKTKFTFD